MFVDDLSDIAAVRGPAIMRDVYRPNGLQSSTMHIPQSSKVEIWNAFTSDPAGHMARHAIGGDQTFIEQFWTDKATRWQDACPGRVVSYKVDVLPHQRVPSGASVVIFHGRPRPREINWSLP
ncbi:hypothetical protein [Bradyrhizobium liaoningense]